jgi:uncharacterized YigZ family protein
VTHRSLRAPARFEQEIRKSRFIGIALPVETPEAVRNALEEIRREFPDATHRTWAYVLGNPDAAPRIRFDDAGEPAGTAGKPILNVLTRRKLGDALVVVVRYFGGVKLGAGGLVRAYSSTASGALDAAEIVSVTPRSPLLVRTDYADEPNARHVLSRLGIEILSSDYGEEVVLEVRASREESDALREEISTATSGRARFGPDADAV